ncbi:formyltransferase family protein [Paenibacillus hexagrammi]|uniref:Formyl transferase N-terminal domain-containing protein n=1 Tax=Paenibacillus hexagrammi TaxID=2908839 RepID=A0ABY3SIK2_9BACL|nr:formyltransferase family protein [Paenibacillus sp. YPD9-1]UJF33210.1 hypothetical protein L0M14_27365 [Paenibacillus sp. YPD9-1]
MLNDVAFLCAPSHRSKAYLQLMCRHEVQPSFCLIMTPDPERLLSEEREYVDGSVEPDYFQAEEPLLFTLKQHGIPYDFCAIDNVNDELLLPRLSLLQQHYVVYSGYGGQILKAPVLEAGKKFIHIHSGIVPRYRGSTTVYYSLLEESNCGASAIFFDQQIDTGPLIATKTFEIPENAPDMDYIFDPYIRAQLLSEVLMHYKEYGFFPTKEQEGAEEIYFIIHPILKHIAVLSEIEPKRGL